MSSNGYQSHRISSTLPHVQKGMPGITATIDSTADPTILQDDDDMGIYCSSVYVDLLRIAIFIISFLFFRRSGLDCR